MTHRLKNAYWNVCKGEYEAALEPFIPTGPFGDRLLLCCRHRAIIGRWPRLRNPETISEWLLATMLSEEGRSELRRRVTDKELLKVYLEEKLGPGYSAKTIGVLHSKREAEKFEFPRECVIKATHDSGSAIIRRDGEPLDVGAIQGWFDRDYYAEHRERNYKDLVPKVLVEELLSDADDTKGELTDYKLYCFEGWPSFALVIWGRRTSAQSVFLSRNGKRLAINHKYPSPAHEVEKPKRFDEMFEIARVLSEDFSFVRVDMYQVQGRLVVGELTNWPSNGIIRFEPEETMELLGRLWKEPHLDVERLIGCRDP